MVGDAPWTDPEVVAPALIDLIEQHTGVDGQAAARAILTSDWLAALRREIWHEGYEDAVADVEARSAPPGPNGPVDPTPCPYP